MKEVVDQTVVKEIVGCMIWMERTMTLRKCYIPKFSPIAQIMVRSPSQTDPMRGYGTSVMQRRDLDVGGPKTEQ